MGRKKNKKGNKSPLAPSFSSGGGVTASISTQSTPSLKQQQQQQQQQPETSFSQNEPINILRLTLLERNGSLADDVNMQNTTSTSSGIRSRSSNLLHLSENHAKALDVRSGEEVWVLALEKGLANEEEGDDNKVSKDMDEEVTQVAICQVHVMNKNNTKGAVVGKTPTPVKKKPWKSPSNSKNASNSLTDGNCYMTPQSLCQRILLGSNKTFYSSALTTLENHHANMGASSASNVSETTLSTIQPSTPRLARSGVGAPEAVYDAVEEPLSKGADIVSAFSSPSAVSKPETTATSVVPPSTPTRGFSFARGGGGDVLIASPSKTMTPRSMSSPASGMTPRMRQQLSTPRSVDSRQSRHGQLKRDVWIVPLDSDLGSALWRQGLCQDASQVTIALQEQEQEQEQQKSYSSNDRLGSPHALLSTKKMIQRLILAYCEGQCLVKSTAPGTDSVMISFRGKRLKLPVQDVTPVQDTGVEEEEYKSKELDEMEERLSRMDLSSSSRPHEDEKEVLQVVQRSRMKYPLTLYRITNRTQLMVLDRPNLLGDHDHDKTMNQQLQTLRGGGVAGLDSIQTELKNLLLPSLLYPADFATSRNHGLIKPPKGVLLHGPSGVGKTALAKQFAQELITEAQQQQPTKVSVEYVPCSILQSKASIVGEAEKRLTRLFQPKGGIGKNVSTLVILDDVHLIASKRGKGAAASDRMCATLLALLDGAHTTATDINKTGSSPGHVVILAITANPSVLDPALRRPGRLDAEVEVPIPDENMRTDILAFQMQQLVVPTLATLDPSSMEESPSQLTRMDLMELSRLAKGFTGADCWLALKEAMRQALLSQQMKDRPQLTKDHIQAAIKRTKPSSVSSVTVEIPKVLWSSIGGMESVKQSLREAIEMPITHAALFESLKIPAPRGVLLYGPPGCSKTLMARALATEGRMNFLAVKGPELLSKWLGESERALASIFRRARMASPCIIFFDEIDAIATKRGGGSGGERLLSQLLTELDGIGSKKKNPDSSKTGSSSPPRVVVVGATNRPDLLDSALTRPGRIDRMIYVGLPDEPSRKRIFQIGLANKSCSTEIDYDELARDGVSGGCSGAEIIAICREAAMFAMEEAMVLSEAASLEQEGSSSEQKETSSMMSRPQIEMAQLLRACNEMRRQVSEEMLEFYNDYRGKTMAR